MSTAAAWKAHLDENPGWFPRELALAAEKLRAGDTIALAKHILGERPERASAAAALTQSRR